MYLIVDEVFADYTWDNQSTISSLKYDSLPCLTFLLNGLSKTLALAQLKSSWIVVFGSGQIIDEVVGHLEFLGYTYLSVNSLVQNAMPKLLLQQAEIQKPIRNRLQINLSSVQNISADCFNKHQSLSGGWWALYSLLAGIDDTEFSMNLLREKNTLIHSGYLFGIKKGYIPLSLITKPEVLLKD